MSHDPLKEVQDSKGVTNLLGKLDKDVHVQFRDLSGSDLDQVLKLYNTYNIQRNQDSDPYIEYTKSKLPEVFALNEPTLHLWERWSPHDCHRSCGIATAPQS